MENNGSPRPQSKPNFFAIRARAKKAMALVEAMDLVNPRLEDWEALDPTASDETIDAACLAQIMGIADAKALQDRLWAYAKAEMA